MLDLEIIFSLTEIGFSPVISKTEIESTTVKPELKDCQVHKGQKRTNNEILGAIYTNQISQMFPSQYAAKESTLQTQYTWTGSADSLSTIIQRPILFAVHISSLNQRAIPVRLYQQSILERLAMPSRDCSSSLNPRAIPVRLYQQSILERLAMPSRDCSSSLNPRVIPVRLYQQSILERLAMPSRNCSSSVLSYIGDQWYMWLTKWRHRRCNKP
ncbi:uncharacterized protein BDR25DRAFT_360406 [Lindgomyces ingoldianus]|uniref:Uncharacterized protein n=1 Tax=Lindgomyces ingoldianus TaxID=673940 RepID=A0ACB6QEP0_9PLEO|nr:uncharacterized protein BDR25DRAFT_360406 [Lindgomyces ingoldianus]KAF2465448.1 hypothetical protein BDR25DRAFT_360406 [Lindgomyces ingoldianus]